MHASHASASGDAAPGRQPEQVLIVGLNWLGDSIMTMPALQAYRRAFPAKRLVMLVKPPLAQLWPMHPAVDETLTCDGSWPEMLRISAEIRERRFTAAFILPQSFRSALVPCLAKIPRRIGPRGHFRSWLLTTISPVPGIAGNTHQQHEYNAILGEDTLPDELPALRIDPQLLAKAGSILAARDKGKWAGLMPGAARGESKRWPAEYFATLGQILKNKSGCNIVLFGSSADRELCARIASAIGDDGVINHAKSVMNLAGKTSLPELAAFMSRCSVVIGNDSGGVHLAAAAGTPVVVIFGLTDPSRTKPLGRRVVVLQDSPQRTRDIPRRSAEAEKSLRNISPEMAAEAARSLI